MDAFSSSGPILPSSPFKNLSKSIQVQENSHEVNYIDTLLYLDSNTTKENHEFDFSLHSGNLKASIDLELSLSTGYSTKSDIASAYTDDNTYARKIGTGLFLNQIVKEIHPATSSITSTSGVINQPRSSSNNNIKMCQFKRCGKGHREEKRCKREKDYRVHGGGATLRALAAPPAAPPATPPVPEGRVHGGSYMAMLSKNVK